MTAALAFDHYEWDGGREALLRVGPANAPTVIVAPPLFEEANRTRALLVAMLRALAAQGIGGVLPDLPGQGESLRNLATLRLADWRRAFAAAVAASGGGAVVAMRGGTLVDREATATARLHVAPVRGAALVRDLLRARRVAGLAAGPSAVSDDPAQDGPPILLAGNLIGRSLLRDLDAAEPSPADRTLVLSADTTPADRVLVLTPPADSRHPPRFRPPWLAAEPTLDLALATALADDIARWVAACAG